MFTLTRYMSEAGRICFIPDLMNCYFDNASTSFPKPPEVASRISRYPTDEGVPTDGQPTNGPRKQPAGRNNAAGCLVSFTRCG